MEFVVEETVEPKKVNSLWVEKDRPQKLDDYIGNESVKEAVKLMLSKKDIPHLLLFGPAGTGKTTLAKMLVSNIPCDYLYINASAERGIDTVRDDLRNFSMGVGFKPLKIVILDEADYFTRDGQAALRNMMESYSSHTRFILTCNYFEKMTPAIVSRCQCYEIKPLVKKDVALKLLSILQAEKVNFTQEDIVFCVNTYYPDIRKVINFAQQSNYNGTLKIVKENAFDIDVLGKLVDLLKNPAKPGVFNEIRQIVVDIDPDTLEQVYRYLIDKVDTYAKGKEALVIVELAESLIQSQQVITPVRDIPFLACCYKLLKHLK
jgi:DNA polymerase III delta prime subunit